MHAQINICNLSIHFGSKILFDNFNSTIYSGQKIAIIGDNGCGKSTLLKQFAKINEQNQTEIIHANDLQIAYIPQIIDEYSLLSGGQRFNKLLSVALAGLPNLLLLDEPTNHLDLKNRKSLLNMLRNNPATQIVVSHDLELLRTVDIIWHIHDGMVSVFCGCYDDYMQELVSAKDKLIMQLNELKKSKIAQHKKLMKEQERAKTSRLQGEKSIKQRKWPTVTSATKAMRANNTASANLAKLNSDRDSLNAELNQLWMPKEIKYSFVLPAPCKSFTFTINDGECGYLDSEFQLSNINISLTDRDRIAIIGDNGSGKSTLVKAILNYNEIWRNGEWNIPSQDKIAYFDQHYSFLPTKLTVFNYIQSLSNFTDQEIRVFLNEFLFCKNEDVHNKIINLSGGEKARLSLAAITLKTPALLILDEITNNIDLTTRTHIINVLNQYNGVIVVISHDEQFLKCIGINERFKISKIM